ARFLCLDEVADLHALCKHRARTNSRERAELAAAGGLEPLHHGMWMHGAIGAEARVLHDAVRADAHAIAEHDAAFEHDADVEEDVAPRLDRAANIDAARIRDRYALRHEPLGLQALIGA